MGQELNNIERMYDTVAKEYSDTFSGEHEKKPKDQEILRRFSIGEEWGRILIINYSNYTANN